jgi:hypothetical protein
MAKQAGTPQILSTYHMACFIHGLNIEWSGSRARNLAICAFSLAHKPRNCSSSATHCIMQLAMQDNDCVMADAFALGAAAALASVAAAAAEPIPGHDVDEPMSRRVQMRNHAHSMCCSLLRAMCQVMICGKVRQTTRHSLEGTTIARSVRPN